MKAALNADAIVNCNVTLRGRLKAIPKIHGVRCILIERSPTLIDDSKNTASEKSELYFVYLNEGDHAKIYKHGFMDMQILVIGDLKDNNFDIQIVAKELVFLKNNVSGDENLSELALSKDNIHKLKKSLGYQSKLYQEAIQRVH